MVCTPFTLCNTRHFYPHRLTHLSLTPVSLPLFSVRDTEPQRKGVTSQRHTVLGKNWIHAGKLWNQTLVPQEMSASAHQGGSLDPGWTWVLVGTVRAPEPHHSLRSLLQPQGGSSAPAMARPGRGALPPPVCVEPHSKPGGSPGQCAGARNRGRSVQSCSIHTRFFKNNNWLLAFKNQESPGWCGSVD